MSDPIHLPIPLSHLMGISRSEARRLIATNAVSLDGKVSNYIDVDLDTIPGTDPVTVTVKDAPVGYIARRP